MPSPKFVVLVGSGGQSAYSLDLPSLEGTRTPWHQNPVNGWGGNRGLQIANTPVGVAVVVGVSAAVRVAVPVSVAVAVTSAVTKRREGAGRQRSRMAGAWTRRHETPSQAQPAWDDCDCRATSRCGTIYDVHIYDWLAYMYMPYGVYVF